MNRLRVRRGTSILLIDVDEARFSFDRLRGLLGRSALAHTEGLLLRRCGAIHTFGMSFSIDVIFLSEQGDVLATREGLCPNRVVFEFAASQILEVAAGSVARWRLQPGEQLNLERYDD